MKHSSPRSWSLRSTQYKAAPDHHQQPASLYLGISQMGQFGHHVGFLPVKIWRAVYPETRRLTSRQLRRLWTAGTDGGLVLRQLSASSRQAAVVGAAEEVDAFWRWVGVVGYIRTRKRYIFEHFPSHFCLMELQGWNNIGLVCVNRWWWFLVQMTIEFPKINNNLSTYLDDDERSTEHDCDKGDTDEEDDGWAHSRRRPRARSKGQDWPRPPGTGAPDNQQVAATHVQRRRRIGWRWWMRCCQSRWNAVGGSLSPCVNNTPQGLTTDMDTINIKGFISGEGTGETAAVI